jgi:acetoin utilization deacetylase AcuC-like enzyme
VLFNRDPEKAAQRAARKAEKKQLREEASAQRAAEKEALKEWRRAHPAEATMNTAALMKMWPSSKMGVTALGPIRGGSAEFVDAGAHKAWTATRLIAGVATAGVSAAATGRKNKGAAVINVTFGNGAAQTYTVKPEPSYLKAANQYVNAFNALAAQLAEEGEDADS